MRLAVLCFLVLFLQPAFAAMDDHDCSSIEAVLKDESCNFQKVMITGRVQSPLSRVSQAGNAYAIFYITDGRNHVKVFMFGPPKLKDGMFVEVTGKFYAKRKSGNSWFYNEIQATSVKERDIISILNSALMEKLKSFYTVITLQ